MEDKNILQGKHRCCAQHRKAEEKSGAWRGMLPYVVIDTRVGVQGGVGQIALRARVHHEAKDWLILTECCKAVNTVKRKVVLAMALLAVPP